MTSSLPLGIPEDGSAADLDNVTDWALEQFQAKYGPHITKDGIWEYMYGVMHAPDWRERYRHDLQRKPAPRAACRRLRSLTLSRPRTDGPPHRLRNRRRMAPGVPRRRRGSQP